MLFLFPEARLLWYFFHSKILNEEERESSTKFTQIARPRAHSLSIIINAPTLITIASDTNEEKNKEMKKRSEAKKKKKEKKKEEKKKCNKGTLRRTASTETVEAMNASATRGGGEGAGRSGEEEMETVKNEESMRDYEKSQEETLRKGIKEREATRKTRVKARGREVRTIAADDEYNDISTDKKQNCPIDLRLMAEEMSSNDVEKEKESDVNENEEENKEVLRQGERTMAQVFKDMRVSGDLYAWQLPTGLPLANGEKLLGVPDLSAGKLGDIELYSDGTAKLVIGECKFDLHMGAQYRHAEEFVIIDEKNEIFACIGDISGRIVASADVDQLIEQSLKGDSGDDDDDDDDDDDCRLVAVNIERRENIHTHTHIQ